MPRTMSVSDSVVVLTGPLEVYARLSDPTAMGRWSPENLGARVRGNTGRRTSAWSSTAATSAVR